MHFTTPIVLFVFNRPDVTRTVFSAIRRLQPRTLFVIGDGPRPDRFEDCTNVANTQAIVNEVDWSCDMRTDFSSINLGCRPRVASGLRWVFEQVSEAIVLEDDCLPEPTFFPYCQDLLAQYRDDRRVFSISGNNFQDGQSRSANGYYFSKYFHCWGWAAWRRTWEQVDLDLRHWPQFVAEGGLKEIADSPREECYWQNILDAQYRGQTNSWAYSWLASAWMARGLSILPDVNLVSNIGFGASATHTKQADRRLANLPTYPLAAWTAPPFVVRNRAADEYTFQNVYARPRGLRKLKMQVAKHWGRWKSWPAA